MIRKCNTIIERVAGVDDKVLTAKEKLRIDAEARFLRAFCYFDLGRTFGKAPLILKAQNLEEDLLVAPSSFAEIVEFVKDECDLYADNLPLTYPEEEAGSCHERSFPGTEIAGSVVFGQSVE